jgi:hypothetical protein
MTGVVSILLIEVVIGAVYYNDSENQNYESDKSISEIAVSAETSDYLLIPLTSFLVWPVYLILYYLFKSRSAKAMIVLGSLISLAALGIGLHFVIVFCQELNTNAHYKWILMFGATVVVDSMLLYLVKNLLRAFVYYFITGNFRVF